MSARMDLRPWVYRISRVLLGGVFVYAAISKIESPQDFADSIAAYQLFPAASINLLAWGLPVFELCCGLFVLTGVCLRIGALGIFALLALFTAAIVTALVRGLPISCGCFGANSWLETNSWAALARDAILLLLAALVYRRHVAGDKTRAPAAG